MANFRSWESDPLFPAAEVVQDSADRMESIFRVLLHDQSLLRADSSDPKLLASIDYHKCDLVTALGTTKWQLEDFERAINMSALSDRSQLREDAVLRHKQFIKAIREQIVMVEKSLGDPSFGNMDRNMHWVNLHEQDSDGLALFLSGPDSVNHQNQYDSENSIMSKFLDSASASGIDDKSDEIVELKTNESETPLVNGIKHSDHSFDSLKENKLRRVGSHYLTRLGIEPEGSAAEKASGGSRTGSSNNDLNVDNSKNKLKRCHSRFDLFGHLRSFWLASGGKMTRSFTKRIKDGEVTGDCVLDIERRPLSSTLDFSRVEQGTHPLVGLTSRFNICQRLFCDGLTNTVRLYSWLGALRRIISRFQYFAQHNQYRMLLFLGISATLILLCLLASNVA